MFQTDEKDGERAIYYYGRAAKPLRTGKSIIKVVSNRNDAFHTPVSNASFQNLCFTQMKRTWREDTEDTELT